MPNSMQNIFNGLFLISRRNNDTIGRERSSVHDLISCDREVTRDRVAFWCRFRHRSFLFPELIGSFTGYRITALMSLALRDSSTRMNPRRPKGNLEPNGFRSGSRQASASKLLGRTTNRESGKLEQMTPQMCS